MDESNIFLGLAVGVAVYFIGYFNGRKDGTDWAIQQVREINGDLKAIYKLMEERGELNG